MGTSVGRVVDSDHDLAGQQMLNAQVPLVDVSVLGFCRSQVVAIGVAPLRQLAIDLVLRAGQPEGKRIGERNWSTVVCASVEIVGREKHGGTLAKRRTRVLEVGGHAHSVINAS